MEIRYWAACQEKGTQRISLSLLTIINHSRESFFLVVTAYCTQPANGDVREDISDLPFT